MYCNKGVILTSKLPTGYIELEYIESTGTQFIDVGRKPNYQSMIDVTFELTVENSSTYAIFGSRNSYMGSSGAFGVFKINDGRFDAYVSGAIKSVTMNVYGKHNIILNSNSITIDGINNSFSSIDFTGNYNLYLFAMNQLYGVDSRIAAMKLYRAKGNINGDFDFIPCKNPLDEIGMYDIIGNQFYGNAGEGNFIPGPEIITTIPNIYVKTNNNWLEVSDIYIKQNDVWRNISNVYVKKSGAYQNI